MRAVWSFWSKPIRSGSRRVWPHPRHGWLSWALSVRRAARLFEHRHLVTDDAGARLLVDRLRLPFTELSTALNALDGEDSGWWALGKLHAYACQTEPFVHIDDDLYLWEPLPERLRTAPVFTQSPEPLDDGAFGYEPQAFESRIGGHPGGWLPEEWRWYRRSGRPQRAECCGLLGGTRTDFIAHYARAGIRLVTAPANRRVLDGLAEKERHNILFEQYLLAACVEYHRERPDSPYRGVGIRYVFDDPSLAFDAERAGQLGFTHVMGEKANPAFADRLERRVLRDHPDDHARCVAAADAFG